MLHFSLSPENVFWPFQGGIEMEHWREMGSESTREKLFIEKADLR